LFPKPRITHTRAYTMIRRNAPMFLAVAAGVVTGLYIWLPSFEQLKRQV
jgi:hypothetical protein